MYQNISTKSIDHTHVYRLVRVVLLLLQQESKKMFSFPSRRHRTVPTSRSVSVPYAQLVLGRSLPMCKASLFTCWLESIAMVFKGEVYYCRSSILSKFCDWGLTGIEVSYWWFRATNRLITSKYNHLDKAMLLLAFLDSSGVFFMLAMIGIVNCMFCCLPVAALCPIQFPFAMHGMTVLLPSGRDRTEWKRHQLFIFFVLLLYNH